MVSWAKVGPNAVDVAAEDACHVFGGLAAADDAMSRLEVDGVAAEVDHRDMAADAGAEAGLFEEHGQGIACQAQVAAAVFVHGLQVGAEVQQFLKLVTGELIDGQEMPHDCHPSCARALSSMVRASSIC